MTDTVLMRQVRRLINALDLEDRMLGGHPRIASAIVKARAILGDLEAVADDAAHAQAGKHVQRSNPDDHRGATRE